MNCTNINCNEPVDQQSHSRCYECEILGRVMDDDLDKEFAEKFMRVLNKIKDSEDYQPSVGAANSMYFYVAMIRHHLMGRKKDMPTIANN